MSFGEITFCNQLGLKKRFDISINEKKCPPPKKKKKTIKTSKMQKLFHLKWGNTSWFGAYLISWFSPKLVRYNFQGPVDYRHFRHFWQSTVWVLRNTGMLQTLSPWESVGWVCSFSHLLIASANFAHDMYFIWHIVEKAGEIDSVTFKAR